MFLELHKDIMVVQMLLLLMIEVQAVVVVPEVLVKVHQDNLVVMEEMDFYLISLDQMFITVPEVAVAAPLEVVLEETVEVVPVVGLFLLLML